MSDDDLPADTVVRLTDFVNRSGWKRSAGKRTCIHGKFEVDESTHSVFCGLCGERVDAFHALKLLAVEYERIDRVHAHIRHEHNTLLQWKPWLRAVKKLEHIWRGNMRPCCPHCGKPVEAEALALRTVFVGRRKDDRP